MSRLGGDVGNERRGREGRQRTTMMGGEKGPEGFEEEGKEEKEKARQGPSGLIYSDNPDAPKGNGKRTSIKHAPPRSFCIVSDSETRLDLLI